MQKVITNILDEDKARYHIGITHTTNKRFWEFDRPFREHIRTTRPQAIEMEAATIFMASYKHRLPCGALLLISDLPLDHRGIKTKESSQGVFLNFTGDHVEKGVAAVRALDEAFKHEAKGAFRGERIRYADELDDERV